MSVPFYERLTYRGSGERRWFVTLEVRLEDTIEGASERLAELAREGWTHLECINEPLVWREATEEEAAEAERIHAGRRRFKKP